MGTKNKTIYELGPSFKTQGGISSVLHTYYIHLAARMNMKFIPTYSGNSRFMDLILFAWALVRVFFICLLDSRSIFQIHSSTYGSYIRKSLLAKICIFFGCSVFFHIHGSDFDQFIEEASPSKRKRILKLLNKTDKVIVLSESWREFFKKHLPGEKVAVIYNPVNDIKEAYDVKPAAEQLADTGGISGAPVKILFMGRMGVRKGTYDLIEAVRLLRDERFHLALFGDGENKKILELVDRYNLQHLVSVNGWVSHNEVTGIYDRSDILVLPSYSEGLPMSVIEAMGRGLPVIASSVGGIPEAVTDGHNGFIIKSGDIEMLADRLRLLIDDPVMRETMGRRSLDAAKERFSIENTGRELESLLSEV